MLAALIGPILGLFNTVIDKTVPDVDKANELKAAAKAHVMQYAETELAGAIKIIIAEAGGSWLQRNWRPGMMVWFAVLIGLYWFGVVPPNMTEGIILKLFDLLQIGIGGDMGGRTIEKTAEIASNAAQAWKDK
jgi:hypothetical protein